MKVNKEVLEDLGFEYVKDSKTYRHIDFAGFHVDGNCSVKEVHQRIIKLNLDKERRKIRSWVECALVFE